MAQLQELQAQQKQLQKAVLDILRDRQYEGRIVNICGTGPYADAIQNIVLNIIGDGENGNEENGLDGENDQDGESAGDRLRRLLREFRSSNKATIELLSEAELHGINFLKVFSPFTEEFRSILPASVTSSSEPSSADLTSSPLMTVPSGSLSVYSTLLVPIGGSAKVPAWPARTALTVPAARLIASSERSEAWA